MYVYHKIQATIVDVEIDHEITYPHEINADYMNNCLNDSGIPSFFDDSSVDLQVHYTQLVVKSYINGEERTEKISNCYMDRTLKKSSQEPLPFIDHFQATGYSVLIPDLRGHGDSGGICGFGYGDVQDILEWMHYLDKRKEIRYRKVLFGTSMGQQQRLMLPYMRATPRSMR